MTSNIEELYRQHAESTNSLAKENYRLKALLHEYGIDDTESTEVSDQEHICVREIARLNEVSDKRQLDDKEIESFERLTKILRQEREKSGSRGSKKLPPPKVSASELIDIANYDSTVEKT